MLYKPQLVYFCIDFTLLASVLLYRFYRPTYLDMCHLLGLMFGLLRYQDI